MAKRGLPGWVQDERRNLRAINPDFLSDAHADTIVEQAFIWIVDPVLRTNYATAGMRAHALSQAIGLVAVICCDAAHADITLQPLHDAYQRAKNRRTIA